MIIKAFKILFPTILIFLTGCASLFGGSGADDWDQATASQSAPSPRSYDMNSEDYRRNHVLPAIENRDIVQGMSATDVISAWGRPREVQVAGDGAHGFERWLYYSSNSLRYDIGQTRTIYFENGRVTGWESGGSR